MGYKDKFSFFLKKNTEKKNKHEHDCHLRTEDLFTLAQCDIEKNKDLYKHGNNALQIDDYAHHFRETRTGERIRLYGPVNKTVDTTDNTTSKDVMVQVEVYKEHDDENDENAISESKQAADNGEVSLSNRKETAVIMVQTDLCGEDMMLMERKVEILSMKVDSEEKKLSEEREKQMHMSENYADPVSAPQLTKTENLKHIFEEFETKLKGFFSKNFDKTVSMVEKVNHLYDEIKAHESWINRLTEELSTKREEIREAKNELKEEKEYYRSMRADMITDRDEAKEAKRQLAEKTERCKLLEGQLEKTDRSTIFNKYQAIEERSKEQKEITSRLAEVLNTVIAEIEMMKTRQAEYTDKLKKTGKTQETQTDDAADLANRTQEEWFDVEATEREFEDLMNLPVQETQEEETELKKYTMDDDNFEERYEFYQRRLEDLGRFEEED